MKKLTLSAVAALALTMTPALYANQTGCNPHPQGTSTSKLSVAVAAVLTVLGM